MKVRDELGDFYYLLPKSSESCFAYCHELDEE